MVWETKTWKIRHVNIGVAEARLTGKQSTMKDSGVNGVTYVLWRCAEGVQKTKRNPSVSSHTVSKINQQSDPTLHSHEVKPSTPTLASLSAE